MRPACEVGIDRKNLRARTGNEPDNDHTNTPTATQIGRLFHLSFALKVIASMTGPWSDTEIAATLNRMGIRTGQGNTWTARRVVSTRSRFRIGAERSETVKED